MEEIWKDIKDYEGVYQISNSLNMRKISGPKNKNIKFQRDRDGYLHVGLTRNKIRKFYLVHRLLMETFIGPCPKGMECRHLDGNPQNNKLNNLCWGSHSDNEKDKIRHGTKSNPIWIDNKGIKCSWAKLNDWKVRIIKRLIEDGYLTQKEIAKIFNIDKSTISNIKRNKRWKHVRQGI